MPKPNVRARPKNFSHWARKREMNFTIKLSQSCERGSYTHSSWWYWSPYVNALVFVWVCDGCTCGLMFVFVSMSVRASGCVIWNYSAFVHILECLKWRMLVFLCVLLVCASILYEACVASVRYSYPRILNFGFRSSFERTANKIRILFHIRSYEYSNMSTRIKSEYPQKWLKIWSKIVSSTNETS